MNRNTIIRIAIPTALYESVKGKVLNEGFEMPDPEVNQIYKTTATDYEFKVVGVDDNYVTLDMGGMFGKIKMKKDKFQEFTKSGKHTLQPPKAPSPNTSTFYIDEAKKPSAGMTKKEKSETKEGIKDIFTKKGATKQKGKTIIPKGDKKLDMKVFDDETAKAPIYKDKIADAKKK
jgi:hypothetical protein